MIASKIRWRQAIIGMTLLAQSTLVRAAQIDIQGPPGSRWFGQHVAVLPNSNIVVTDPGYSTPTAREVGAVYLFDTDGKAISALTGSSPGDHVGNNPIVVLANGNFVVSTPDWNNGEAAGAGAVTWIDGASGISGVVSAANSLVGMTEGDFVGGYDGVVALNNGNYVVRSSWSSATALHVGAVTWANGATGLSGIISEENSLVGSEAYDFVGEEQASDLPGIVALPNGNYVVTSASWHYNLRANFGAVTLGDGRGGTVGQVGAGNSLLGTTTCPTDVAGLTHQVQVLANSNFVVPSPCWSLGGDAEIGAVTWVDGVRGLAGEVSVHNSFVGTAAYDRLGSTGITPLSNGNYVILSFNWGGGRGAATWADGRTGRVGHATPGNSLVGSTAGEEGDYVGLDATALDNGNYVVRSWHWNGPQGAGVGAATWGDGFRGTKGVVSAANSIVGTKAYDYVSFGGVAALANGAYVVASPYWSNGANAQVGAATWADGSGPTAEVVTSGNSLTGSQPNDAVGAGGVIAVGNANYVVASPFWSNGSATKAGAVTFVAGSGAYAGAVSADNSLVGASVDDTLGYDGVVALTNGNYVVASAAWHDANNGGVGAITWGDGNHGRCGAVSAHNSLVGTIDYRGTRVTPLVDGNYVVSNQFSLFGEITAFGSISLADGGFGTSGVIAPWNSVVGDDPGDYPWTASYDVARKRLVVGRPGLNMISLFAMDQVFASAFE